MFFLRVLFRIIFLILKSMHSVKKNNNIGTYHTVPCRGKRSKTNVSYQGSDEKQNALYRTILTMTFLKKCIQFIFCRT